MLRRSKPNGRNTVAPRLFGSFTAKSCSPLTVKQSRLDASRFSVCVVSWALSTTGKLLKRRWLVAVRLFLLAIVGSDLFLLNRFFLAVATSRLSL